MRKDAVHWEYFLHAKFKQAPLRAGEAVQAHGSGKQPATSTQVCQRLTEQNPSSTAAPASLICWEVLLQMQVS